MCLRLLLPYRVHLHVACCYASLAAPAVQYRTICTMLVRFNVNQFADILVSHLFFFGELHIDHHFLPQPSFSSFPSLSASLSTRVLLPLIPGEFVHCCLVVLVDCCRVVCDFTMMNLVLAVFLTVGASLPYCKHIQCGLHGTVLSVLLLYSTVPTMLTVSASLPYCMPVRAALYIVQ